LAPNRWFTAASIVFFPILAAQVTRAQSSDALLNLPDDPATSLQQTTPALNPPPPPPPTPVPAKTGSAGQTPPAGTPGQSAEEIQRKKAQEQLEEQEHQRVLGVMATFNTTNNKDALPLTPRQKYQLFFKSATDPWPFGLAAFSAGIDQAENSFPEYGQGVEGYAKRFGADYADYFTGNFFGNAVLTSWWHEDPRYFQKGTGSFMSRFLWASASTVWCRRDNGTWGPNYANVVGNLMGSAVSNVYYPASDRTVKGTIERGVTVSVEGIVGAEVIEFWPDIVRRHKRKEAEKLAKQAAQKDGQSAPQPAAAPSPAPAPAHPQN
jgi:hypothetical protein